MKQLVTVFSLLSIVPLAAIAHAQVPKSINGSDTLEEITSELVNTDCRSFFVPPGDPNQIDPSNNARIKAFISYIGGGSGTAANEMLAQLSEPAACQTLACQDLNPSTACTASCMVGSPPTTVSGEICCHQVVGPMSRPPSSAECNSAEAKKPGTKATAQALVVGLDGIVVVGDSQNTETCGGGHTIHGKDERPGPSFSDLPLTTDPSTGWKAMLSLLFTGVPKNPATPSDNQRICDTAARKAALANYTSIFNGGCTTNACPGGIKHLFRRGDLSGTTDTFLSLIGAPSVVRDASLVVLSTPFCNGKEGQDADPVRRPCTSDEQVCEFDGTLGALLPIVVPTTTNEPAALYNASNSPDPAINPTYKNVDPVNGDIGYFGKIKTVRGTACPEAPPSNPDPTGLLPVAGPGTLGHNLPAGYKFPNNPRCDCRFPTPDSYSAILDPSNNTVAFPLNTAYTWNKRFSGRCWGAYHPNSGSDTNVRYGVLNGDDGTRDNSPTPWGNRRPGTQFIPVQTGLRCCAVGTTVLRQDPRAMNLALRNPTNADGRLLGAETAGPKELNWATITAFYRIHSNTRGQTCVAPSATAVFEPGDALCQEVDATRQIACLVQYASHCSYGYAGREAGDSTVSLTAEPFAVGGIDPTVKNIQRLVDLTGPAYPLSRKLYLVSLLGFDDVARNPSTFFKNPNGAATTFGSAQFNLYKCMADITIRENTGIAATAAALDESGFVELPPNRSGPKLCRDVCTTNPTCTSLAPIPAADLVPAFTP